LWLNLKRAAEIKESARKNKEGKIAAIKRSKKS